MCVFEKACKTNVFSMFLRLQDAPETQALLELSILEDDVFEALLEMSIFEDALPKIRAFSKMLFRSFA